MKKVRAYAGRWLSYGLAALLVLATAAGAAATQAQGDDGYVTSPRLRGLGMAVAEGREQALSEFWREIQAAGTPLV